MPRKPVSMPQPAPAPAADIVTAHEAVNRDSANALVAIAQQTTEAAQAMALQVGYDGTLAVGALEDEIRFYQRRTVEAILETGKRLLVLKELTPRGEFDARVELLGFSRRTAYRFMQAAGKTSKSANLAQISSQIKNASAFLELVTHDEDTLEDLSKLDDIDRMSASQVRAYARELKAEHQAGEQVRADLSEKLTKLQVASRKKVAADTDWPDALQPLTEQIAAAGRKLATALSELETCRITAMDVGSEIPEEDGAQRAKFEAALDHVATVYRDALVGGHKLLANELGAFDATLANFIAE